MLKVPDRLVLDDAEAFEKPRICLLDPGMEDHENKPSANLGDLIIQQAVLREIHALFEPQSILSLSTHTPLEATHFKDIQTCSIVLVGGTNLLSSQMNHYNQWKFFLRDALRLRKRVILMGVSWWQYQGRPNFYTTSLLHLALSSNGLHSVRDNYTKSKLKSIGLWNVLNTSCPTMWPLANLNAKEIPQHKAQNVLLMLTDYAQKPALDRKLLELISTHYETVYFWPQGAGDRDYITSFNLPVKILDRSIPALERLLQSDMSLDYIGTRLHGGIRCLLARRRSLVLKIDHRATEIAQETGLPAVDRDDFKQMEHWIQEPYVTRIALDMAAIEQWRNQFSAMAKPI